MFWTYQSEDGRDRLKSVQSNSESGKVTHYFYIVI